MKTTPWRTEGYQIFDASGAFIGSTFDHNADKLIVTAVNAHDALVEALTALVKFLDDSNLSTTTIGGKDPFKYGGFEYSVVTEARDALKLAEVTA